MTDEFSDAEKEQLDALDRWVRSNPRGDSEPSISEERMKELTQSAIRVGQERQLHKRRGRRLKMVAAVAVAAATVAGGAVAAYMLTADRPSEPLLGVTCRASSERDSTAVVLGPDANVDPVGRCRERWLGGSLGRLGPMGQPPHLIACVGDKGAIEVMPGEDGGCKGLGFAELDLEPSAAEVTLLKLERRVRETVNEVPCLNVAQSSSKSRQILDELGLVDWKIKINPDAVESNCTGAIIVVADQQVIIHTL